MIIPNQWIVLKNAPCNWIFNRQNGIVNLVFINQFTDFPERLTLDNFDLIIKISSCRILMKWPFYPLNWNFFHATILFKQTDLFWTQCKKNPWINSKSFVISLNKHVNLGSKLIWKDFFMMPIYFLRSIIPLLRSAIPSLQSVICIPKIGTNIYPLKSEEWWLIKWWSCTWYRLNYVMLQKMCLEPQTLLF